MGANDGRNKDADEGAPYIPTPEEVEARAAEIRERNMQRMRSQNAGKCNSTPFRLGKLAENGVVAYPRAGGVRSEY